MKLHELGAHRPIEQTAQVLESQTGLTIDFLSVGPRRAQGMLQKAQKLLREYRSSPNFHHSQQDPAYLQLVIMEQALRARVTEVDSPMVVDVDDPKTKQTLQKAERGQTLSPDEQKTISAIALMKKEAKRAKPMVREQSELQQAQVVLAAQDMIDRVQGMLEDISEMQFKDLPALADSIKNDMGAEQATQFQSSASAALTQLLTAVQAGKTELEGAQGVLTGQAPQIPGADTDTTTAPAIEPPAGDEEADLSLDANLPAGDEEEEDEVSVGLGRERR